MLVVVVEGRGGRGEVNACGDWFVVVFESIKKYTSRYMYESADLFIFRFSHESTRKFIHIYTCI